MPGNLDLALRIRADLGNAVRNLDKLQSELRQTQRAGQAAGQGGRSAAAGMDRASRSARRANTEVRGAARGFSLLKGAVAGLGFAIIAREIVQVVDGIKDVGIAYEALDRRAKFATGSVAAGTRELAFVRAEADRLGLSFQAAAQGYTSLGAAARGTIVEGQGTREIFLAVSEAAAVLELTTEKTSRVFTAFEQIISKGKVSAEELRQQLGDALPGAVQTFARALGISTAELDRRLEQGQVGLRDLLKFVEQIREDFEADVPAATERSAASFARLGNAIEELQASIARSGLLEFLADAADLATRLVNLLGELGQGPEDRLNFFLDQLDNAPSFRSIEDFYRNVRRELEDAIERGIAVPPETIERIRNSALQIEEELLRAAQGASEAAPPLATPDIAPESTFDAKAFERAQTRITKFFEREEARRVSLTESRIAAVENAERQGLRKLEQLRITGLSAAGSDEDRRLEVEENYQRARVELEASTNAEIERIREEASKRQAIQAEREADRQRDVALSVVEALQDVDAELGLSSQFDQDVQAAARWRDALIVALRDVGLGHTELERLVNESFQRQVEAAKEQTTALGGLRAAVRDYSRDAQDSFTSAREAADRAFRGMEDALVDFVRNGKLNFSDLANSIIADLARIAIRQQIVGPLASAFGNLFNSGGGGGGGLFSPFLHAGGRVGSGTQHLRQVPPEIFRFAPRYHRGGIAGLEPDEVPAILRRNELVLTEEQQRGLGGMPSVQINFENRGTPQRETGRQVSFDRDARRFVIDIVTEDLNEGGPIRNSVQRAVVPGGA